MPKYNLNNLGDVEFEKLIQSLLKRIIGPGTTTFGAGRDGAREATFSGSAPYPSETENWNGSWIFQAKFHDTDIVPLSVARSNLITDTKTELYKVTKKYKYDVDNYIIITNVPLSGVHGKGTIDRLDSEVFSKYRKTISNLEIWGADEIYRFLELYPEVRRHYIDLLITGDVIAELLTQVEQHRSDRATTIDMYLRAAITREENAQLDQAGDVSEDAIPLQRVFFDLNAYIPTATRNAVERLHRHPDISQSLPMGEDRVVSMVAYLINSKAPDRVVIVGGPGEGKSTIGQYLAQLHRATLLEKTDEVAISPEYVPEVPRLPFRVVLKDFAQWLADYSTDSSDAGNLDTYITEHITKLSTRKFTEKELHEVLKTNPAVVILDGLDEVTDATVRRRLLVRLIEFIDRCTNTLRSDIQIIATTRPTNYSDQFDPKTFLHFRLHKLSANQVRDYVARWAAARVLEEDKAIRLRQTIEECLRDNQISLLMTTPLQVTILILIINSGGTPPRQREALFNDYLEVIYKREKAKGLGIVKTEKELLIGLHKFVGYLLHEEATKARTSSATLPRSPYGKIVRKYLRKHDPYSPDEQINAEWHAITVDAGERLVLIVESSVDTFGFELRSIQEFFAACYLLDTSSDTDQRYERFSCIAYLPHWRNVALFFAGRVGRNYTGEAANIIEVCKQIDRSGPDLFVKRGAELALELAAERALGPNRVLQRSLLEYGLSIFDGRISIGARQSAIEMVKQLPEEDVRDHILPILEQRLPTLGYAPILNACELLVSVAPESDVLSRSLIRIAAETGNRFVSEILEIVSNTEVTSDLRVSVIRALLAADADPKTVGENLVSSEWPTICSIAIDLKSSNIDPLVLESFMSHIVYEIPYAVNRAGEPWSGSAKLVGDSDLVIVLQSAELIGRFLVLASAQPYSQFERISKLKKEISNTIPSEVKTGSLSEFFNLGRSAWFLWLAHFIFGDVSASSWELFLEWLQSNSFENYTSSLWSFVASQGSPIARIISSDWDYHSNLGGLAGTVILFSGEQGRRNWLEHIKDMWEQLGWLQEPAAPKLALYGPGILDVETRSRVMGILDLLFDPRLQPIALDSLDLSHPMPQLTVEEFDRHSEWFASLTCDDPWRRKTIASRMATQALHLGRVRSSQFEVFIPLLDEFVLPGLTLTACLNSNDEDLTLLLSKLGAAASTSVIRARPSVTNSHESRRRILLRLLSFVNNESTDIRTAVCKLIEIVCQAAASDDARPAVRSSKLDSALAQLVSSQNSQERRAGIALYVVRPPRSNKDWAQIKSLLKTAEVAEVENSWRWILPSSADLTGDALLWANNITSVLEDGTIEELSQILVDVVRKILPRQDQSLVRWTEQLKLPTISG